MLCPECHKFYTCRFCHDENSIHSIDRYSVEYMACMHCKRIQVGSVEQSEHRKWDVNVYTVEIFWGTIIATFATSGVTILTKTVLYPFLRIASSLTPPLSLLQDL